MTRPCNVTSPTGARCERARSHRGDHAGGGEQWPRGERGGRTDGETASIVLSALASGASTAEAARAAGVSRQRAHAIARAAAAPPASQDQLIARLRELAAAYGEDPDDWLEDAARCRAACKEIVAMLHGLPLGDGASPATCERIRRLAIGPTDRALAAQVRGAIDADEL